MASGVIAGAGEGEGEDPAVIVLGRVSYPRGFVYGFAQPCLIAPVTLDRSTDLAGLGARLCMVLEPSVEVSEQAGLTLPQARQAVPALAALDALVKCLAALQEAAGINVVAGARVMGLDPAGDASVGDRVELRAAIPSLLPAAATQALDWLANLANHLARSADRDTLTSEQEASLARLLDRLRAMAPPGNNVRHWIRAALGLGMPVRALPLNVYQFGEGRHARLFQGSATDAAPYLGGRLATNKLAAAMLLRAAEIPVPEHEVAFSSDEALAVAERIGFPVVIKPVDQSRGLGATAGIASGEDLRKAYDRACAFSSRVIVERHVPGQEYRLLVVNGRLFWAYQRLAARVIGDGLSTIAELIETTNRTRRPGPSNGRSLAAILVGEEMIEMLAEQGRDLEWVPASGEAVVLQRVPSNAGGGELRPVFDIIHPDNALIAERAARLLRLDIAGIDFLSSDITRSWREVGARIIEVNNHPQISPLSRPGIHRALLGELMHRDGRVPVAVVLGDDGTIERETRTLLTQAGICAGLASPGEIRIGSALVAEGAIDPFRGARALVLDGQVEAILLFTDGEALLRDGLPFDRVDVLVIAGSGPGTGDLRRFLRLARPHVREVIAPEDHPDRPLLEEMVRKSLRLTSGAAELPTLLSKLLAARAKA